jgi:large subunit ribosomal protein L18
MEKSQRKMRVRGRLRQGRSDRPRLSVFRSLKYIYAQVIDDNKGVTLAAASGKKPEVVGEAVAKAAVKNKVTKVVFDRGEYKYHGRVQKLAQSARKGGLDF